MKRLSIVFAIVIVAGCAHTTTAPPDRSTFDATILTWPEAARMAAMKSVEKYGLPQEATATMLIWHNAGPWKRSIIYRDEVQHDFPMPHKDVWEQFVDYRVPADKFDELAMYDGSVIVERTKGEISARCDKEEANFLAINLADDIVDGRRSVEDARRFYARTIQDMMQGRTSPYLQGLRIGNPSTATADRDVPATSMISSSPQ